MVQVPASKKGLPRPIYLSYRKPLVRLLYKYVMTVHPEMLLFYHLRSSYTRKGRVEITDVLRYHIKSWFENVLEDSISPYYLRHNRFSKLSAAGAKLEDIRMLKGSKTIASVMPYLHMSTKTARELSRKID